MSRVAYESSALLQKAFLEMKANDRFSLRKWSELTGINAATLNLIINSKRLAPQKHLAVLASSLGFDSLATRNLERAHGRDWLREKGLADDNTMARDASEDPEIHEVTSDDSILLKSWSHLALLEFTTCENFREDTDEVATRFGLSPKQVRQTFDELEQAGFVVRSRGRLKKKNKKMRVPTQRSREIIRKFHLQMLQRAIAHLQASHDRTTFGKRLITGYTVAVNPENVDRVKVALEKALLEASAQLATGSCSEVYQLQLQLFPLTQGGH